MNELPPANYHDRVEMLLANISWHVVRTEQSSTCHVSGPCEAHPDRGERCKGSKGVSYYVEGGILKGTWVAWGVNAEESIFNMMVTKLDETWFANQNKNSNIAQALRNVGR